MKRPIVLALWIAITGPTVATKYECTAVDKKAITYSKQTVTLTEDASAKTCTFSVAGATSKEAPNSLANEIARFRQDFASIRGRFSESMSRLAAEGEGPVRTYLELLFAAGIPDGKIPDTAARALSDAASKAALRSCANDFIRNPTGEVRRGASGFECFAQLDESSHEKRRLLVARFGDGARRWSVYLPDPSP